MSQDIMFKPDLTGPVLTQELVEECFESLKRNHGGPQWAVSEEALARNIIETSPRPMTLAEAYDLLNVKGRTT